MGYLRTFQAGEHADDAARLLNEIAWARQVLLTAVKYYVAEPEKIPEMSSAPPPLIAEVVNEEQSVMPVAAGPSPVAATVLPLSLPRILQVALVSGVWFLVVILVTILARL